MTTNAITQQLESASSELSLLNKHIAELSEQIGELQRKRDIVLAKVEAFELSAKYMADMQSSTEKPKKKSRKRMPSSDWVKIFDELYKRYADGFNYDQVIGVASTLDLDMPLKRPSLRTKMMNLATSGYVERLNDGEFKITDEGVEYFNLKTAKSDQEEKLLQIPSIQSWAVNNEASEHNAQEASKVTEDVTASSNEDDKRMAWPFPSR
jgi:regulator of replication initiation timing